jgi:hypothetical protein
MKAIEIYKTRKDELVQLTLNLLSTALSGDRANITFFFKVNEETSELTVDYHYYLGQIYTSENCFLTIHDYETPNPTEYGFETIEEMDFEACGYDKYISQSIDDIIASLEME